MNIIDCHAYWDPLHMSLNELARQMDIHRIQHIVLSAPCTKISEPDKSAAMYAVQRMLLRNNVLRPIAEVTALSFYDKAGRLRPFWRLFTKKGLPINKVIIPDNAGLLNAIRDCNHFYAWHWVNPSHSAPDVQLEGELNKPKVIGIKLHAYWHTSTFEQVHPIVQAACQGNKPIYFILGFQWLRHVPRLLNEFPKTNFIFGYGGFPYFDALWKIVLPYPNAFIDFASNHIDGQGIRDAVAALGPKRCLYSSDCPYSFKGRDGKYSYAKNIERLSRLNLSIADLEQIFLKNAQSLLFGRRNT